MTEKRFYYTGDGINRFSGVIDYDAELSVEETVGILNELAEENKQLIELVYFVNTLIASQTSSDCQEKWKQKLEELIE